MSQTRRVTLFTGQWADLPLAELAPLAKKWGYDGLELACWGDHFDVQRALKEDSYCDELRALLAKNKLGCWAISAHLVGQCVCDQIDERHKTILPERIWGDGDPEGVRRRAAAEMIQTAQAAAKFGVNVVNGFTGSSIWPFVYDFPPTPRKTIDAGYEDFAARWLPILDNFQSFGVKFALEVHPAEIAFDVVSAKRALEAVNRHPAFGFNYDPSHLGYQGVGYVKFIRDLGDRIFHVHMKDAWWGHGDGSVGVFGGHVPFGDPRRYWDFRSIGHGDVRFEDIIVALNDIGYDGPLSVEGEDMRMDRFFGAREACGRVKALNFLLSNIKFDAAFEKKD